MAGSNATKSVLSELAKRVPSNQTKQFRKLLELNSEYKRRVDKYPEKLPRIDWDYYRTNVRVEAIKMVDEFEKKYEELNKVFDDRFKLDTKKYYDELEKQRLEVQAQVKQYIAESNERIKAFEAEIARLCHMKPYSAMTMEEFINLRPECSEYIPRRRKPLFWPHDPDEQLPGPADRGTPKEGGESGGDDGDGGGVSGGTHSIKPDDIKSKMEKFKFEAAEGKTMKTPNEPTPKLQKEAAPTPKTSGETEANIEKPQGTIEQQTQPRKKPHPCDLIKQKPEEGTCKPERPHKHGDKSTSAFFDPCGVGFGARKGDKSDVEAAESKSEMKKSEKVSSHEAQSKADKDISKDVKKSNKKEKINEPKIHIDKPTPKEVKDGLDPCKIMGKEGKKSAEAKAMQKEKRKEVLKTKIEEEKTMPPKKPHPCDLIEQLPDDLCKPKELAKNEKNTSSFFDPCNVGFGVKEGAEKSKSKPQTKNAEKLIQNMAESNPKTCKDISDKTEDCSKEEDETSAFVDICADGFGVKTEAEEAVEKIAEKSENSTNAKESDESSTCNLTKQKQEDFKEYCAYLDTATATKSPCDAAKKPKAETNIIKDKNSVTMVFAEPKEKLSKDDDSKRRSTPSKDDQSKKPGPATPYYNPFRSEEENKKVEDEMCDVSKNEDPCSSKIRDTEEDYYDPCKDEKE